MSRERLPSRPDLRVDPDSTPPRGYAVVERGSSCDSEHRDMRDRLGKVESARDDHEDRIVALENWTEGSKVTQLKKQGADEYAAGLRKPLILIGVGVTTAVLGALILMVVLFAMRGCPGVANQPTKVEVKP